jgi:hypothetical protein
MPQTLFTDEVVTKNEGILTEREIIKIYVFMNSASAARPESTYSQMEFNVTPRDTAIPAVKRPNTKTKITFAEECSDSDSDYEGLCTPEYSGEEDEEENEDEELEEDEDEEEDEEDSEEDYY